MAQNRPADDDTLRKAAEAEEAGKESLGSAATNAPPQNAASITASMA